jgi:undecaprenyl-diphosphatase
MDGWQAALMGLVEGLTEYLPVSSTGHLLLVERLMGIKQTAASDAFAVAIQLGAILAVLVVYVERFRQMAKGLVGRDTEGRVLVANIAVGFAPAALLGVFLGDVIKSHFFNMYTVAGCWAAWGLGILVIFRHRRFSDPSVGKPLETLTWRGALMIGLFQVLAMIPGTSRSLVTIIGALVVGLSLPSAVEFSFLLGVVTLGAATCYDLVFHGGAIFAEFGVKAFAIGLLTSFVAGISAIKWMVSYLSRHGMTLFGWYRIGIAAATVALLLLGIIAK